MPILIYACPLSYHRERERDERDRMNADDSAMVRKGSTVHACAIEAVAEAYSLKSRILLCHGQSARSCTGQRKAEAMCVKTRARTPDLSTA